MSIDVVPVSIFKIIVQFQMLGPNLTCNNKTNIVKSIKQMGFVCTETEL